MWVIVQGSYQVVLKYRMFDQVYIWSLDKIQVDCSQVKII